MNTFYIQPITLPQVTSASQTVEVSETLDKHYKYITGIAAQYLPNNPGEIVVLKINSTEHIFGKGTKSFVFDVNENANPNERFIRCLIPYNENDKISISYKDDTTGTFTAYQKQFILWLSDKKPFMLESFIEKANTFFEKALAFISSFKK
jgi:hypothetical protein